MRLFIVLVIMLAFSVIPALAFAGGEQGEKSENPYGLTDQQWGHLQDGNLGRAEELQVGDVAPDFDLLSLDGKSRTRLAELTKKRPVVLFFGSYT